MHVQLFSITDEDHEQETHREAIYNILELPTQLRQLIRILIPALRICRLVAHPCIRTVTFASRVTVRRGQPLLDGDLNLLEHAGRSRISAEQASDMFPAHF
jgi:hypothetical protein